MKAFISIKFYSDARNRYLIETIDEALTSNGIETACIIRDVEDWGTRTFSPNVLMEKTFEILDDCNLLVIEFSDAGFGIGIEAGYAHAKGIKIITIAKEDSEIPTTLKGISSNVFLYKTEKELKNYLKKLPKN